MKITRFLYIKILIYFNHTKITRLLYVKILIIQKSYIFNTSKKLYGYFYSKKCNSQSIIIQFPYGVIQKSYKIRTIFFHRVKSGCISVQFSIIIIHKFIKFKINSRTDSELLCLKCFYLYSQ